MTRTMQKKFTAITLCIIMITCTLCTIACVTDQNHKDAQFFAADFSMLPTRHPGAALEGDDTLRIVSWLRNPEAAPETGPAALIEKAIAPSVGDKPSHVCSVADKDRYSDTKTTNYFLRI